MHRIWLPTCWLLVALLGALAPAADSQPAKFNKVLRLGDAAPAWTDLPGVDGRRHALADLRAAKAVVVFFTCQHCPVAAAYEARFNELAKTLSDQGVRVTAINVSRQAGNDLPAMQARAKEHGFAFAYLRDASQQTARKFGAFATPHVFVLDGDRKVAYMGAFDDHQDPPLVTRHYVRDAVMAVLRGERPPVGESRPRGCPIDFAEVAEP